jgi:hypothetical protein
VIVGLDINSRIVLKAYPNIPILYLEKDAMKIVDGLAKDSL